MIRPSPHLRPSAKRPGALEKLSRYGLAEQDICALGAAFDQFHCTDSCPRVRACEEALRRAAMGGDHIAVKLLSAPRTDRLATEAVLAYGCTLLDNRPC